jgi:site-specific recombinase XerD
MTPTPNLPHGVPAALELGTPAAFIEDKKYLMNVTRATLVFYGCAFKAFTGCTSETEYKQRIVSLLKKGIKPISVNTWLTCINNYLHWQVSKRPRCHAACELHFRLAKLKVEDKIIGTLSMEQVRALLNVTTHGENARRVQVFAAVLLDTGLREMEVLSLRRKDVDLDALTVKVMGKGRKERVVPLSTEGRKWLYLWMRGGQHQPEQYIFATSSGLPLSARNAQRDLKLLGERAKVTGVRMSPHTLRHTFAVAYLRNGGNLEYLRRILGHSDIKVTQRYLRSLGPDDLQRVHTGLSPLSRVP